MPQPKKEQTDFDGNILVKYFIIQLYESQIRLIDFRS